MGNVLHFCPCPQILHTYCKFSRENCENICDQYCKLWKYLWQILRTLSSFTSLLTELHYNHLHWPCLQISAISLSQISMSSTSNPRLLVWQKLSLRQQAILSDRKPLFSQILIPSQFKYPTKWHLKNAPISPEIKRSHNLHLELPLYLWN